MNIRGIVFDIGGVLEITPSTGYWERWHGRLGLRPEEIVFVDDVAALDYGAGGDVFEWQLFTADEICELAAEFGLKDILMGTEFDDQKPVTPEKPQINLAFKKARRG